MDSLDSQIMWTMWHFQAYSKCVFSEVKHCPILGVCFFFPNCILLKLYLWYSLPKDTSTRPICLIVAAGYLARKLVQWQYCKCQVQTPKTPLKSLHATVHIHPLDRISVISLFVWSEHDSNTYRAVCHSANLKHLYKWHLTWVSSLAACAHQITSPTLLFPSIRS